MKKLIAFLALMSLLFGYKLVVKDARYVDMLRDLGVLCEETNEGYECARSNNKEQLLKVQAYLKNNLGIVSYVVGESDYMPPRVQTPPKEMPKRVPPIKEPQPIQNPQELRTPPQPSPEPMQQREVRNYQNYNTPSVKSGYCIQVLSSPSLPQIKKAYEKVRNFPLSRIEKIGPYYVIRIGEEDSVRKLKSLLRDVKGVNRSAFIRKCDLIENRIIEKNF